MLKDIMKYSISYLSKALKAARERKNLTQRELASAVGMPQAQISKIENAVVDMRSSTLIELARTLDLEVMLVPRTLIPAVKSIVGATEQGAEEQPPRPAYTLGDDDD